MSHHITRGDRGMSESLQWTLLAPVIVLLILGAIEAAIVVQARSCVTQAALAGAEAETVTRGGPDAANRAATNVAEVGGLTAVSVSSRDGDESVQVSVVAHVSLPIDLGFGRVEATATLPKER